MQFIAKCGIEYGLQFVTQFFLNPLDCLYTKKSKKSFQSYEKSSEMQKKSQILFSFPRQSNFGKAVDGLPVGIAATGVGHLGLQQHHLLAVSDLHGGRQVVEQCQCQLVDALADHDGSDNAEDAAGAVEVQLTEVGQAVVVGQHCLETNRLQAVVSECWWSQVL